MWGGKKGEKAYIPVYMIFREKSERDEGIFHIKKTMSHLDTFHKVSKITYKLIKPLSSHSRDICFLIIILIINIILAAAQIYNFLRLEGHYSTVGYIWIIKEFCCSFTYTLEPASINKEVLWLVICSISLLWRLGLYDPLSIWVELI